MMTNLVHLTAAYSNALLVAILPYVSDFSKKLRLDIQQPVTPAQVIWLSPMHLKDSIDAGLVLSNHYWFAFSYGAVNAFHSPDDPFCDQDPAANWPNYAFGKDNMTTNEAIQLARTTMRQLGYQPEDLHADGPPTKVQGPTDLKDGHHVPHCRIEWAQPWEGGPPDGDPGALLQFDINLEKKALTGLCIMSRKIRRPQPKVAVQPELESDYQQRIKAHTGKMFIRTNAPPRFDR